MSVRNLRRSHRVAVVCAVLAVVMLLPVATALGQGSGTVGLYVEYGDGAVEVYCMETVVPVRYVEALIKAEDMADFVVEWHEFEGLGKALCGIDRPPLGSLRKGVEGCTGEDCFCNPDAFWNYHYLPAGGEWSWSHWGNMDLHDGDVGVFVFDASGTQPSQLLTLDEICAIQPERDVVPQPTPPPAAEQISEPPQDPGPAEPATEGAPSETTAQEGKRLSGILLPLGVGAGTLGFGGLVFVVILILLIGVYLRARRQFTDQGDFEQ